MDHIIRVGQNEGHGVLGESPFILNGEDLHRNVATVGQLASRIRCADREDFDLGDGMIELGEEINAPGTGGHECRTTDGYLCEGGISSLAAIPAACKH